MPGANEAHVWRCNLDALAEDTLAAEHEKLLSDEERARAVQFRFPLHRARFIAGRATLRILLARYLNQPSQAFRFRFNAHGKPSLENSALRFNVSHSEHWALFAFCDSHEIGVDIELRRADFDAEKIARLAGRFFCEAESNELQHLSGEEKRAAFFRCWTRKEALLKATGEGIAGGLKTYQVSLLPGAAPGVLAPRHEVKNWSLFDVPAPAHFAAALAVRAPEIAVRYLEF